MAEHVWHFDEPYAGICVLYVNDSRCEIHGLYLYFYEWFSLRSVQPPPTRYGQPTRVQPLINPYHGSCIDVASIPVPFHPSPLHHVRAYSNVSFCSFVEIPQGQS